ncbi:MAG: response regulator [Chthoniobacterales bacterium]
MVNEAGSPSPSASRSFQVLILEPDDKLSAEIVSSIEEATPGASTALARSVGEAQHLVIAQKPELFVLDVDASYDAAQEFIYDLRTSHPSARAIILTATHFTAHRDPVAGLGAMHFLEKPFPRADFITLVEALLASSGKSEGERFQGTLSDLHIADIIQLKCISGATSMLEFTGPRGEKARVYFDNGQVRHATSPGKEGRDAFNQIVDWKGGVISEVPVPEGTPRTITSDWQVLLMEAVRNIDETRSDEPEKPAGETSEGNATETILVIDDSLMLLSFVKEILTENHYHVVTAPTAEEGLRASHASAPDLILLDYILPDMKGDEVCRKLVADAATSKIPVVYMSGFGSDLRPDRSEIPNVIGSLSKPFTSESLVSSVESYLKNGAKAVAEAKPASATGKAEEPKPASDLLGKKEEPKAVRPAEARVSKTPEPPSAPVISGGRIVAQEAKPVTFDKPAVPAAPSRITAQETTAARVDKPVSASAKIVPESSAPTPIGRPVPAPIPSNSPGAPTASPAPAAPVDSTKAYFCGDSSFFSLHWALQTIAREKLTGVLRTFWSRPSVELLAREGKVIVVTTRDPQLYCEEAPVTLVNVEPARVEAARKTQSESGCPLFISLAKEDLILHDPGLQLVQHYGQKLFAQLWNAERVRFVFEQQSLPDYARDLPMSEASIDQWALSTLRFVQYQELGESAMIEPTCVPAYTRDGYDRVQQLRLTVAEAQFASQFNGTRSVVQISKNLRLDIKFARLTLFRFLALEIVECWPAQLVAQKPETRGGLRGIFSR